jgi:hypothetical protein
VETANASGDLHDAPARGLRLVVRGRGPARYAMVRSTPRLEAAVAKSGASDNWRG